MSGQARPRARPGRGPRHAAGRRPARAPRPVAELPGRPGRARGDPRRGGARRPGAACWRSGPASGSLTGGLLRAGAEVTAVELDSGLAAFLRDRFDGPLETGQLRLIEGDALDQDLVGLVEPPYDVVANLPYHITSPILHALLGAPPAAGALGAHGPARGRGADRGAAREDELPLGLRAVPRPRPDRVHRPPGRRSSRHRPSNRRSSSWSRSTPTTASIPRARTSSGGSSRRASASAARCSTTSWRASCRSMPRR